MATKLIATWGLYEALKAEGMDLPAECREVQLLMPADGVFILRYDVMLTEETLAKVGLALKRLADRK